MPNNYYDDSEGDGADTATRQAMDANRSGMEEAETEAEEQPTFLMPKSALMGKEVSDGDVIKVRIVRQMDDQVEAVCVYGDEEEEEEAAGETMEPAMSRPYMD
jgi:hypothetical protein